MLASKTKVLVNHMPNLSNASSFYHLSDISLPHCSMVDPLLQFCFCAFGGFKCGVCFVIVYSSSFLLVVPRKDCAS